jgi:hypothetical protein
MKTNPSALRRVIDFVEVYRLYRRHHPRPYALRRAWGIAFQSLPF